jgi:MarR family transcriptional regulator for hemolysin
MATDKKEQLGLCIGEVFRHWRTKVNERLLPLGLSQAKWLALLHLSRCPQGIIQKDLAERIGIESPTLVRLLDRLEADGWVTRKTSKLDRRSKAVYLTPKAQPTLHKIKKIVAAFRHQIFFEINEDELAMCLRVMTKIKGKMESL